MEPQPNYPLSVRVISLLLVLSCSRATVSGAAGAARSGPTAPRHAAPQAKPTPSLPRDVAVTDPCALSGARAVSVRALEAKAEQREPEAGGATRNALPRELWSGRIAAPESNDDAQTSLALKRLIRQVRVLALSDTSPAPATAEPSATARTLKAATTSAENVAAVPPAPGVAAAPQTASASASQMHKTLEGLRKNAGRVRDPLEVAELLFLSGRPTEAVPFYEEALRRTSAGDTASGADRSWILFQLGNCLRESDATKAQDAYAKLIAEFPSSPWTEMARASRQLVAWYQSTRPDQLLAPPTPKEGLVPTGKPKREISIVSRNGTDRSPGKQPGDNAHVLIVETDSQTIRLLLEILARKGIAARLAADRKAALDALDDNGCDLAFLSAALTGASPAGSFQLLSEIRAAAPEMPVVMMAGPRVEAGAESLLRYGTRIAVRAIQAGCRDFLLQPLDGDAVDNLLESLLPNRRVATAASAHEGDHPLYQIIGKSPKLVQTIALAERIAPTSVPVLISGESGTGKELVSLLIHHQSRRALGPFVRVNCAALSDSLLESELFGHEKGAFTGAYAQHKGRFEMAHGGTLLLDEITETPPRFQAKLLRIIEQQEFERVGGNENVKVNVRLLSTTNRDLLHEVQMGRFRQDLYYRLSAARVVLAPLRDRREDLPELVWHFVNLYAKETQRRIEELDLTMMEIFANYDWPGNVRQLRNVVLTSLLLGTGPVLSLADVSWLFDELQPLAQQRPDGGWGMADGGWNQAGHPALQSEIRNPKSASPLGGIPLQELERQAILETLRQTSGNQTKAAKVLGISDRTLREKVRRYRQRECLQPVS